MRNIDLLASDVVKMLPLDASVNLPHQILWNMCAVSGEIRAERGQQGWDMDTAGDQESKVPGSVADEDKFRVLVSGGGPVGMAFALLLAEKLRGKVKITIYDERWRLDEQKRVVWKGEEEKNARRQQVVTLQSRQFTKLPNALQYRLFYHGSYSEMWPVGPDSVRDIPPRNIRVRDIEDIFLAACNESGETINLVPEPFYADSMEDVIKANHLFVISEGARSKSFEHLKAHFGAPNQSMYSIGGEQLSDFVLGLRVKSSLPDPAAVLLTISQNRFLLNARNGEGFLNVRLASSEVREVRGFIEEVDNIRVVDCIQSRPCLMETDESGMFKCSTHGSIFGPKYVTTSKLWPRLKEALRLFKIDENDFSAVTAFRLEMLQRPRFTIPLVERTADRDATYACLIGDSANAIHFWPGRGLNSGLASAISLSRCVSAKWRKGGFRDADFARHEAAMAMLQYRHKTRAWRAMVAANSEGVPVPIRDIVGRAIEAQAAVRDIEATKDSHKRQALLAEELEERKKYSELLLGRMEKIGSRLAPRIAGVPDRSSLLSMLDGIDAQTLRVMYDSGAWDSYNSGGDEVDVDMFYQPSATITSTVNAAPQESALPNSHKSAPPTVIRKGLLNGRRVVEYSDGNLIYEN